MTRPGVAVAALFFALALTRSAGADATRDADRLFEEGKQLMDRGNVAAACARFEASVQLQKGIGVRLWLADCYEALGRTATAQQQFRAAAEEARVAGDKRAAIATKRAEQLEPRIVKIVVSVENPAADEHVDVDGAPIPSDANALKLPVDPGRHLVTATAAGRARWQLSFDAQSPERPLEVVVPELTSTAAPPAPSPVAAGTSRTAPSPALEPAKEWGAQRTTGAVVMGVGALGLVAGGVLALLALGDKNASEEGCHATCTQPAHDRGERALHEANAATVAFVAGGALLGGGGLVFFTAAPLRAAASPAPHGGVGGVFLRF